MVRLQRKALRPLTGDNDFRCQSLAMQTICWIAARAIGDANGGHHSSQHTRVLPIAVTGRVNDRGERSLPCRPNVGFELVVLAGSRRQLRPFAVQLVMPPSSRPHDDDIQEQATQSTP